MCSLEEMSQAESRGATAKELVQGIKYFFVLLAIEVRLDLINFKSNLRSIQQFYLFNLV